MSDKFKQRFAGAAQAAAKAKQAASAKAASVRASATSAMGNLAIDAKRTNVGQMLRHKTLSTGAGLGSDAEYTGAFEEFTRLKRETRSLAQNVDSYKKGLIAASSATSNIAGDYINLGTERGPIGEGGEGGQHSLSDNLEEVTSFVALIGALSKESCSSGPLMQQLDAEVICPLNQRLAAMESLDPRIKERDLLQKDADTCGAKFQKLKIELAKKDGQKTGTAAERSTKDAEKLTTTEEKMKQAWSQDLEARNALLQEFNQYNNVVRKEIVSAELAAFQRIAKSVYTNGAQIIANGPASAAPVVDDEEPPPPMIGSEDAPCSGGDGVGVPPRPETPTDEL
jgi:hypothetical protein